MLQQTQVSTVLARFYHPFLERFPTIESLAEAPREAVLKAWEGLGYYRRAGYLHEAAKLLTAAAHAQQRNAARMPESEAALLALPGIGKNTARAILAFGYHQPVAILEANVKRIVARIFALEAPSENQLWESAENLLNAAEPFAYNQSMMDLGSLVCTPRNPACGICPAQNICLGKIAPERYPTPKAKKQVPVRRVSIEAREDALGRFYLETRSDALLGGLYGFPQMPRREGVTIGEVVHIYSHFRLEGRVEHRRLSTAGTGPGWYTREEIRALPLSKVDHKVLALIDNCNSGTKKRARNRPK